MLLEANQAAQVQPTNTFETIVKLVGILVWPTVTAVLALCYRRSAGELLTALTSLAKNADQIKLWQVEVKRDISKVLDRSAESVSAEDLSTIGVPTPELKAAQQVSTLLADSPTSAATERVLDACFQQMLSLARDYEITRASMKPSDQRTIAMNAIVAKMRALGPAAKRYLHEFTSNSDSPGSRLAGIVILQMTPDDSYIDWLAGRMKTEQPFLFFHASLALLAAVRFYGASRQTHLAEALQTALSSVLEFSGSPDTNTVQALETALDELG